MCSNPACFLCKLARLRNSYRQSFYVLNFWRRACETFWHCCVEYCRSILTERWSSCSYQQACVRGHWGTTLCYVLPACHKCFLRSNRWDLCDDVSTREAENCEGVDFWISIFSEQQSCELVVVMMANMLFISILLKTSTFASRVYKIWRNSQAIVACPPRLPLQLWALQIFRLQVLRSNECRLGKFARFAKGKCFLCLEQFICTTKRKLRFVCTWQLCMLKKL